MGKDKEYEFFYGGYFSQWYPCEFTENNIKYNCAEQYMMAHKALLFNDIEIYNEIMSTDSPFKHKKLGKKVKNFNEEIWKQHREQIVYQGNLLKFSQNEYLKKYLLSTDDKIIVEASPTDTIWGIGLGEDNSFIWNESNWQGLNLLGIAIMKVRNYLKNNMNY